MARQAPSCAAVGASKAAANQLRVAGENESSAEPAMTPIVHPATDNGRWTCPPPASADFGHPPGPARIRAWRRWTRHSRALSAWITSAVSLTFLPRLSLRFAFFAGFSVTTVLSPAFSAKASVGLSRVLRPGVVAAIVPGFGIVTVTFARPLGRRLTRHPW